MKMLKTLLLSASIFAATNLCAMDEIENEVPTDYTMAEQKLHNAGNSSETIKALLEIAKMANDPQHPDQFQAIMAIQSCRRHIGKNAEDGFALISAASSSQHDNAWLSASFRLLASTTLEYESIGRANLTAFVQEALLSMPDDKEYAGLAHQMAKNYNFS